MAKILICDDSNTILNVLEKKLKDAGHEVIGRASDGEAGTQLFSQTHPDITLLDVTMPNRDGRECLKEILRLQPAAKVIMLSALNDQSVARECLEAGAKAFVRKACLQSDIDFRNELLHSIEHILKAA